MQNYYLHSTADPLDDTRNMRPSGNRTAPKPAPKQGWASWGEAERAAALMFTGLFMLLIAYLVVVAN